MELPRSATRLAAAVRRGEISAEQVARHFLGRVEAANGRVQAFLHVDAEDVLQQARELGNRSAEELAAAPLLGVPVAIKDNICTRGVPTTCASRILAGHRPGYDASVVARLRAAGALVLGKTNCDEFAMGASTENSGFMRTCNPHDLTRVPGGSSGGSAAALAAGLTPLALGSDTGGSVRQPAAFCGNVGMRPTYGAVSRFGLIAFASSLDQIGPMAMNVADCQALFDVICGPDARDSTSHREALPRDPDTRDLRGVRIGVPEQYEHEAVEAPIQAALQRCRELLVERGAILTSLSLPLTEFAIPTYYLIVTSEASSNLARFDGVRYGPRSAAKDLVSMYGNTRAAGFGAEVKRRILLGTFALSAGYYDAYYKKALQVRQRIREEFQAAFQEVDFLLGPTTPSVAFGLGEKAEDPLQLYLCDIFTAPSALAGIPAVSVPAGRSEAGLPIGMQLIGPARSDHRLLHCAAKLEEALGLDNQPVEIGHEA